MKGNRPVMVMAGAAAACSLLFLLLPYLAGPPEARFVTGQYDSAPRMDDGRINVTELLRFVRLGGGNTFNMLIRMPDEDFAALEQFLPLADATGVDVWVTLLPPSELSQEQRDDIRYTDYIGLVRRIAALSAAHPNLVAWSIDNVLIDKAFFTPPYLERLTTEAKKTSPGLRLIPVVYYNDIASPYFSTYSAFFDGVQFYYTNFPAGQPDEADVLLPQLAVLGAKFGKPVILGVYATPMVPDRPTTAAYVSQLINLARQHTAGVMVYTLQRDGEKLDAVREAFGGGS